VPEPDESNSTAELERRYWRVNVTLVVTLMSLGFGVSFVFAFFARSLADLHVFGWSFSYYMAAQGVIFAYVLLVTVYAIVMGALDRRFRASASRSP
jgi:putative solute:sodium symporter small subunit